MDIRQQLAELIKLIDLGLPEDKVIDSLIELVHDIYKDRMLVLFLKINELDKKDIKAQNLLFYRGLEDGMHGMTFLGSHLLEDKTSKQAKSFAKDQFEGNNLAHIIYICRAYFPKGTSEGASNNGKWFFDKFLSILKENKDRYLEGGDSYDWTIMFNHKDYIDLVIKENNL